MPFTTPHRAFILYLCREQANLRGNNATLEYLSDDQATVKLETMFFYICSIAGHLNTSISIVDDKQIFETLWHDRAKNAEWNLDIQYSPNYAVTFNFCQEK